MTKTVIFDFDGTLADTFAVLIEITNELAPEFGYQPVDKQQITQLQGLSSREIVKIAGISRWQIRPHANGPCRRACDTRG